MLFLFRKTETLTTLHAERSKGVQVIHFTVGEKGRAELWGEGGRRKRFLYRVGGHLQNTSDGGRRRAERKGEEEEVATLSGCSILSLFSPQTSDMCVCVCACTSMCGQAGGVQLTVDLL